MLFVICDNVFILFKDPPVCVRGGCGGALYFNFLEPVGNII